jgi:hypothetical protein
MSPGTRRPFQPDRMYSAAAGSAMLLLLRSRAGYRLRSPSMMTVMTPAAAKAGRPHAALS